jgi:adenylate kinase
MCTNVLEHIEQDETALKHMAELLAPGGHLVLFVPAGQYMYGTLDEALGQRGRSITAVLLIEADDDVIIKRLAGRRVCEDGHVYHVDFNPPEREGICDVDGKELIQRDDDKPETIEKRLATYHDQTEPLVTRYEDAGVLQRFDGTRPADEVHDHIRKTLSTLRLEERM